MYECMLHSETWTEEIKWTASDGASGEYFGRSIAFSGDMLLAGDHVKYGERGAAYALVIAGDGLWDEGTRLYTINGIDQEIGLDLS